VRNNVVYDSTACGISIGGYAASVGGSANVVIVNNTLYNNSTKSQSGEFQIQYHQGSGQGNYFENNIVYAGAYNVWLYSFVAASTTYPAPPATLNWNVWYSTKVPRAGACGLSRRLLFQRDRTRAARRAFRAIPQLPNINLEFVDGPAQSVSVHVELARGTALVAFVFLQDGEDKSLLKLTHALGIKNVASVHLQDERFQLIFHGRSLS
jgi:hypothetical protein